MKRVLTALVLLPLFIIVVILPNPWYFTAFVAAAAVLAAIEYFRIAEASGFVVEWAPGMALTLGFVASAVWPADLKQEWLVALGLFLLLATSLRKGVDLSKSLGSAAATLFGTFYVGFLLSYLVALKSTGENPEAGKDLIFLVAVVTWAGDTTAYYGGRAFGKHLLAPAVSPKKTWEGAAANVAGSLVAAVIAAFTFIHKIQWTHALVLGLALSVVGQVGDLCESVLKRGANVKDSSALLPGHGGVLDRLDSILFNAPLVYYYHLLFLR